MRDSGDSFDLDADHERQLPGTGSVVLPTMIDLDDLQSRLDDIDAVLADLDRAPV